MKVLVTGVTGFLGGRVAGGLASRGWNVRGLVRDPSRWESRPATAEVVEGDVTAADAVRRAVSGCDAVVHAAALVKVWARDRRDFDRVNVEGLRNVVEAARDARARVVYTSSFIALGPSDATPRDESPPRAGGPFHNDYERTKWIADRYARHLGASGYPIVRLYPGVVYGPGALTAGNHVVGLLLQHARGRLAGLPGGGRGRLSFAFVDDVVAGFVAALEKAPQGSGYVLGGDNRSVRELFGAFERASGIRAPRRHVPFWIAALAGRAARWRAELTGVEPAVTDEVVAVYRRDWTYTSSRAESDLGYRITPLEQGIERTVRWLRESGELPTRGGS
jgi:farnesol dehydrogenase